MKKLIAFGVDKNKIIHIPYFVHYDKYTPNYSNFNYLLYFGRLERHKGIKALISAMKRVNSLKLYIVGEGSYRNELEKYMEIDNVKNVLLVGYKKGKELNEFIKNSLFTIVPSEWYENCPLAVLESFALGKPVIGADIGGIPDLVDNEYTGMLFERGNVEDLAEKISYLLNNKNLVAEMGRNASKKIEAKYNKNEHYMRLMEAYNKVI
jgi:glycosyltransferase involved in cell wall biosynthesis